MAKQTFDKSCKWCYGTGIEQVGPPIAPSGTQRQCTHCNVVVAEIDLSESAPPREVPDYSVYHD